MWIARLAIREREMTLAKPVSVVWLNEGQQERQRDRERGVSFIMRTTPFRFLLVALWASRAVRGAWI